MAKQHPKPQPKPEPEFVRAAYRGITDQFRLYPPTKPGERPYVRLPNGKRATVTPRRDGTFIIDE